jgi:hypothetical protein
MARTILIPTTLAGPWARAGAILIAGGAFVGAASLFAPDVTTAQPSDSAAFTPAPLPAPAEDRIPAYLGTLSGAGYTVDVFVGRTGPLYTVKTLTGETLDTLITGDRLSVRYPNLSIRDMHASAGPLPATDSAP